jgi:hypothetical protein
MAASLAAKDGGQPIATKLLELEALVNGMRPYYTSQKPPPLNQCPTVRQVVRALPQFKATNVAGEELKGKDGTALYNLMSSTSCMWKEYVGNGDWGCYHAMLPYHYVCAMCYV